MALSASNYYSKSIQGIPGAGADVDVTAVHSAPKYALGYLIERADGARYRYCYIGTATNAGNLVGQTQSSGGAAYGLAVVVAPASATAIQSEYPILPGQVGSHWVQATIASIAANKYQGGYLITTRGTGVGDTYSIVGNTATGNPNTTDLYIQLAQPLKVALTAATGLTIVTSIYNDLAASATSSTTVTGVLMTTTTSANQWAWVCTRGQVGCCEDNTVTVVAGYQLVASQVTAGAYAALFTGGVTMGNAPFKVPIVGYSLVIGNGVNRQGVIMCTCE